MIKRNKLPGERIYSADLAIDKFPGKWQAAHDLAVNAGYSPNWNEWQRVLYWLRRRQYFLELGGQHK